MEVTIELPDAQADKLRSEAHRLGVEPRELLRAVVVDLLNREEPDFSSAAEYVLRKNEGLYNRLV